MSYSNIRDILGRLIGLRVVDITQHDEEEFKEDGACFIMLMFEDGSYLRFPIGDDGFSQNFERALDESE
jgi:hypothetical protein